MNTFNFQSYGHRQNCTIIFALLSITLSGCFFIRPVPPDPECFFDGKRCGGRKSSMFTGRWYEYYQRGISYLDCECYEYALKDLSTSISIKTDDKRFLNTYGMHFIHYFPNRERGLTYYLLNQYGNALTDFENSIHSEPSEKAFFYIEKIRKQFPKASPAGYKILLNPPFHIKKNLSIKQNKIILSGKIFDDHFISKLFINDKSLYINRSEKEIPFKKKLNLNNGINKITIEVHNLSGQKYITKRSVFVDNSGPLIVIHPDSSNKRIKGLLIDDSPIQSFTINAKNIQLSSDNHFSMRIYQSTNRLKAIDKLGNITIANYSPFVSSHREKHYLAYNDFLLTKRDHSVFAKNSLPKSTKILLKGISNAEKVFRDHIKLDGIIRSELEIYSFTIDVINNEGHTIFTKSRQINNSCKQLHFSEDITLFKGNNNVTIKTKDASGQIFKRIISIEYQQPSIYQLSNRYKIKILPIDNQDWQNEFSIVNRPDILQIKNDNNQLSISKSIFFINQFMQNIDYQKRFQITCSDDLASDIDIFHDKQINKTKSQSPHALLITDTWADRHGIEISTRLVDIETSTIMTYQNANKQTSIFDAYSDRNNKQMLSSLAARLTEKICHEFPLETGMIINKNKNSIVVSLEQKHLGWPVLIYYKKPKKNLETGHSFGAEYIILDSSARINYRLKTGYEILTQCHTMVNNEIEVYTK